jgi:hypothetical protein
MSAVSPRVGAALAATVLLGVAAVAAPAASPATTAQLRQAEIRLQQLDRQSETPAPASAAELRSTIARWRAAAAGYGRLGAVAATGERSTPPGARRVRAAWAALRDLAGWRARQLSYSADLFSETLRGGMVTDGAKEGIARMTLVEGDLRARLRAALARVAT